MVAAWAAWAAWTCNTRERETVSSPSDRGSSKKPRFSGAFFTVHVGAESVEAEAFFASVTMIVRIAVMLVSPSGMVETPPLQAKKGLAKWTEVREPRFFHMHMHGEVFAFRSASSRQLINPPP
jgi:hypothetical protein